jgi:hypothetical protein
MDGPSRASSAILFNHLVVYRSNHSPPYGAPGKDPEERISQVCGPHK